MFLDLRGKVAIHELAGILNISEATANRYALYRRVPRELQALVWREWCEHFEPWRVRSRFDRLTWGVFATPPPKPHVPTADDWSI